MAEYQMPLSYEIEARLKDKCEKIADAFNDFVGRSYYCFICHPFINVLPFLHFLYACLILASELELLFFSMKHELQKDQNSSSMRCMKD